MIGKMLRRDTPEQPAKYASRNGSATCVGGSFPMNLPVPELIERFREVMNLRPELREKVLHIPVRLTDMDRDLSEAEWGLVAQRFVEAHGLTDCPWMAWTHPEGRHGEDHLHIVALNVDFTGTRIDLGQNFKTNKRVATALEKELNLWRAPRVKGGKVLPPLVSGAPGSLPAPGIPIPESPGKYVEIKKRVEAAIRPGMTLVEFRDELAEHQVELDILWKKDGVGIRGLGYSHAGTYGLASAVGRSLSLSALNGQGVTYVPARDLARLAPPPPALVVAATPPPAALPTVSEAPVPVPVPAPPPIPILAHQPPSRTYEVPRVHQPNPQQTFFRRAQQVALGLWGRVFGDHRLTPVAIPVPGRRSLP